MLLWAVLGLEAGDFRRVLDPHWRVVAVLGSSDLAVMTPLLLTVAHGLWALARGDVLRAKESFGSAVRRLPKAYRLPDPGDGCPRAALRPAPESDDVDDAVARLARLLWREQHGIDRLTIRVKEIEPADAFLEAIGQEATWTTHDIFFLAAVRDRRHTRFPVPTPRQRKALCERATVIVRLDRPNAGPVDLSSRVWRMAGGYEAWFAELIAYLGEAESPAPWRNARGAETVPVRPGCQRLWEHARGARGDRIAWT
ncbi:hypothetical protein [Pseudonocardia endophytica]|uniref:hypothetical protein n=1 Tax=Pseudonocardia endophytica TaxID=401976 RepID=UPI00104FDA14|nr:hypothetical protein [Pseudonocardia endophytica]